MHRSLLEMFVFAQNRIAVDVHLHHKTGQAEMESHSTADCTAQCHSNTAPNVWVVFGALLSVSQVGGSSGQQVVVARVPDSNAKDIHPLWINQLYSIPCNVLINLHLLNV